MIIEEVMLNGKKIELIKRLDDDEMQDEILIDNDSDKTTDLSNEINRIKEINENEQISKYGIFPSIFCFYLQSKS